MGFLGSMEGIITSFRRGRKTQTMNQIVILVQGVDNKEKAGKLVGKEVKWVSPGKKEIKGKISAIHGNSGAIRAIFERGMPGQSLGKTVSIQ